MTAREEVLARVRTALGPSPAVPEVARAYRGADAAATGSGAVVERFCDRVSAYRATVTRATPAEVEAVVTALCRAGGGRRVVAAPGIRASVPGLEVVQDEPALTADALDGVDVALTGCALAIAETGTIVLDAGAASGRRLLALVPDHHVCVVWGEQVVAGVPDAIAALAPAAAAGRPLTLVSGPSATSDIELERVEGVHGPRRLDVVVVA
jgi:L-lactate dehydrogenase complex protein LldG